MARLTHTPEAPREPLLSHSRCPACREFDTMRLVAPRLSRCAACASLRALPRHDLAGTSLTRPVDPAASAPLAPGTVLRDRYRLVEQIGRGAHGLTFLAYHQFLNHPCVVKTLPHRIPDATDDAVRRLRNEACAGFGVRHENVVGVLDGDVVDDIWYFVMDFVDGVDLGVAVSAGVLLDWRQAVQLAIDAARGLDAIHRARLVHRDIKPANLILDTEGHVRLADLGVARLMDRRAPGQPPTDGDYVGTLAYVAPEVLEHQEVGPAADLYSLGATFFELLTGKLPRGDSVYKTFLSAGAHPAHWPEQAADGVPEWLRNAILRLLAPDPADRFESAAALASYLERPADFDTVSGARPAVEPPPPRGLVVLPWSNEVVADENDWLGHALADHLGRFLASRPDVYVARLDQFLETFGRVERRAARPRCEQLLEAGRLIGAGTIIEGSFRRAGENISLSLRVYQAAQREPLAVGSVQGPLASLATLEADLHRRLAALLGLIPADAAEPANTPRAVAPLAEERLFAAKRAFLRGDYEKAGQLGQEALAVDPDFGDAAGFVGVCFARAGNYDRAVEFNRQQQDLAARHGDERLMVEAHANLGSMHYFRGDYRAANECLAQAARAAAELGLTAELASIRNNLGFVLLQLGQPAEAEQTYLQAIETHKKYGALVSLIGPYNGLGHVLCEQKRYDEAGGYYRRALSLAQESDDYVNIGVAHMNLGHCALLQRRLADAKTELVTALNMLEQTTFWNGKSRVYEYMTELNLELGNYDEAIRCADKRIELAQRHANVRMEVAAWQQKAAALRLAGRTTEAEACLARARELGRGAGDTPASSPG